MLAVRVVWPGAAVVSIVLAFALASGSSFAQKLYKHVDEKGNVVFSDRPQKADQKAEKARKPNVSSSEATRQTQIEMNNSRREEMAERNAQQRRAASAAAREREEKARQRRTEEERNPERAPRQIRIVR